MASSDAFSELEQLLEKFDSVIARQSAALTAARREVELAKDQLSQALEKENSDLLARIDAERKGREKDISNLGIRDVEFGHIYRRNGWEWTLIVSLGMFFNIPLMIATNWPGAFGGWFNTFLLMLLWAGGAVPFGYEFARVAVLRSIMDGRSEDKRSIVERSERKLRNFRSESEARHKHIRDAGEDKIKSAQSRLSVAQAEAEKSIDAMIDLSKSFESSCGNHAHDWDATDAVSAEDINLFFRLGRLSLSRKYGSGLPARVEGIRPPALASFPGKKGLLFLSTMASREQLAITAQAAAFRLSLAIPPGKVRFTLIDPLGLGQSFSSLIALGDYHEALVGSRVWTDPRQIRSQLADLSQHMENVIQKYLRDDYDTITEFNLDAGRIGEAYRVLIVNDFPHNFTAESCHALLSIAQNGPRCGVFPIIVYRFDLDLPHGVNADDFRQALTGVAFDPDEGDEADRYFIGVPAFENWRLSLDPCPSTEKVKAVLDAVGSSASSGMRVVVPFDEILQEEGLKHAAGDWDRAHTTVESIIVPLGPTGARNRQTLTLGKGTAHHALIIGQTGSGKSNLLHVIISGLAVKYSPDEVELYLIDFKKGVEFKSYANAKLPHARVIAIQSEREFGLSVFEGLQAEMERRGDLFKSANVQNIADFRRKTGEVLPRCVLIMDEFSVLFDRDDKITVDALRVLDRLVRQGRAFGVHIILASQSLGSRSSIPRSILDQMAIRIVLKCNDADSKAALADDNPEARLLTREGEAIYNDKQGLIEGNARFQAALIGDDATRETFISKYLEPKINALGDKARRPIVFEGSEPVAIENSISLRSAFSRKPKQGLKRYADFWLGEPLTLKPEVSERLARQGGGNLLLVMRDEDQAASVMTGVMVGLAAQFGPNEFHCQIVDMSSADTAWPDRFSELAAKVPNYFTRASRRELRACLEDLDSELESRLKSSASAAETRVLALIGLQRMRDLRRPEGYSPASRDGAEKDLNKIVARLLAEGPDVGIHLIIWSDSYPGVMKVFQRQHLDEIALRVAGPLSDQDSRQFLDSDAAARIDQPSRAVLHNQDKPGQYVAFRPFKIEGEEWLEHAIDVLAKRKNPARSKQKGTV